MVQPLYIAFLWHQHQPYYKDNLTNTYMLPWVRLHGTKDYYDMVQILDSYPLIHQTFNLVPSLLIQIEDYGFGNVQDTFLNLTIKPAGELDIDEKIFVLKNFFMANWENMVEVHPRYKELLVKRGRFVSDEELKRVAEYFRTQDFLDLQMWFNLSWMDPYFQKTDDLVKHLIVKGRYFTEEEKLLLCQKQKEIMRMIIPKHKELQDQKQIEISTTPFYHPILPLLIDTNSAKIASPEGLLPTSRFNHPEDADAHIKKAVDYYEKCFGKKPNGMWPAEGSVSPSVVPLFASHGIKWIATDQDVLFRSLDVPRHRELLYMPYTINIEGKSVSAVFRDKRLSDMIGFSYARFDPKSAVDDFLMRLRKIRKSMPHKEKPHLVSIILDGENCWEHYKEDGSDFLNSLYEALSNTDEFRCVNVQEYLDMFPPERSLPRIWSGSWINHNFDIWIGHSEDNTAWDMLYKARRVLVEYQKKYQGKKHADIIAKAWEEFYIAEGSDWFWWFGDQHSSDNDREFDALFRKHLMNIYTLISEKIPDELYLPIKKLYKDSAIVKPVDFISPKIDGVVTNYFEWYNAGVYHIGKFGGAMHHVATVVKAFYYGFDEENLYIRIDPSENLDKTLFSHISFSISFIKPKDYQVVCDYDVVKEKISLGLFRSELQEEERLVEVASLTQAAVGKVLELVMPFKILPVAVNEEMEFVITVKKDGFELERWPYQSTVTLLRPNKDTLSDMWWA